MINRDNLINCTCESLQKGFITLRLTFKEPGIVTEDDLLTITVLKDYKEKLEEMGIEMYGEL